MDKDTLLKAAQLLASARITLNFSHFEGMFGDLAEHYWTTQYSRNFDIVRFMRYLDPPHRSVLAEFILRMEQGDSK